MKIESPTLAGLENISHGFFTRRGGMSEGVFASLNCGYGSGDDISKVAQNRSAVTAALGSNMSEVCTVFQEHGANCVVAEGLWNWGDAPHADAIVTKVPGLVIGVLTADCVPVLFADAHAGVVAAAHAGWKGAYAGIIESTVHSMMTQGADLARIEAAIGPCIAQASYEVGEEFYQAFLKANKENEVFFVTHAQTGHKHFDVSGYVRKTLEKLGISRINQLENDTCAEEDLFFSFRRATHRGETAYGRQVSSIMLKTA